MSVTRLMSHSHNVFSEVGLLSEAGGQQQTVLRLSIGLRSTALMITAWQLMLSDRRLLSRVRPSTEGCMLQLLRSCVVLGHLWLVVVVCVRLLLLWAQPLWSVEDPTWPGRHAVFAVSFRVSDKLCAIDCDTERDVPEALAWHGTGPWPLVRGSQEDWETHCSGGCLKQERNA